MTSNKDLNELSKALTAASPADLKNLRAKINGLLELGTVTPGQPPQPDDWLWEGIVEELVSRGLLHSRAATSLQRSKAYRSYLTKAEPVRALLLSRAKGLDQAKVVLNAFGKCVAHCLAESLSEWTVVTPSLMLTHVDRVPSAVDECFPGYLDAGLLSKLVKVSQPA